MKKLILILSVILMGYHAQAQCNAPVINSFSPNTGFIGSTVTITGAYFETTPANNVVYFGATKATVVSSSFGTLTVIVPVGASTAPISVTNACNKTAYSSVAFNGIFCPTPVTNTTYQNVAFTLSGYGAYNMLSQDMDLDGKPDVVSARNDGGITIAINGSTPGNLSFTAYNINIGNAQSVYTADFDGDGKKDIATTYYVLKNTSTGPGNIGLANVTSTQSVSGYQIAAGDFNNDGKIDLVGEQGGVMWVSFNISTGPGNFAFAARQNAGSVGTTCTGIQVADVDGDGKTDILATQGNANRAVSIRNITTPGSATISVESPEYWSSGGNYPYRCQIADFDKDGKIDLTTCNYNNTTNTAIFRNTSTVGDISFASTVNLSAPVNNYRIQVGDCDGDGYPDIVVKSLGVNVFSVYKNTSTGPGVISFANRIDYSSSAMAEVSGIVIGDLDGDYVPDIATSGISSNTIRFHRNTSSQSDQTPPTAICKNITVALSPTGTVNVTAAMIDNGSSDACGIGSLLINNQASVTFTCANVGANTVTLKVIDRANNVSTCTATVNVAPAAIIASGQTTVCQGQTVTLSANTGDTYQWALNGTNITGATSQTYVATTTGNYTVTVTNSGGCSGTSSATAVTVNSNPTVNITPAGTASLCNGSIALTASTSSIYQWKLNGNNISGATQQVYTATSTGSYSVSVIDLFGCTANSNTVTVNNTPPEIDVTGNGNSIADGDGTPSTTDGTDMGQNGSATKTFTISNSGSGDLVVSSIGLLGTGASKFTVGGITLPATIASNGSTTFTVTYTATAIEVNNAVVTINNNDCNEASYDFAIKGELNCTAPAISNCPQTQYQQIYTDANSCNTTFTYSPTITGMPAPTVSYSFSGATSGSGSGTGSGSTFNTGQTTVTITATNTCGTATCSFVVTVIDNKKPSVVTKNITVYLNASGQATITPADVNDGSSDNCGSVSLSLSQSGTICGTGTENQNVSLNAPSGATITSIDFASYGTPNGTCGNFTQGWCHSSTSKSVVENAALNHNSVTIGATNGNFGDPCYGTVKRLYVQATWTGSGQSNTFNCSKVGNNTVTLIVTDANGNVQTGTATVTVIDTIKPAASAKNITVYLNASGTASITASQVDNGSTDECGIASRSLSKTSFDCSNVGANTVTLTVVDNNGNSSTANATVTVVDNTAPSVATSNYTLTLGSNGTGSITVSNIDNGSSDACGIASMSLSKTSFDCSNVGANTVTLTVVDNNGNSATSNATVTVVDNTAPSVATSNYTLTLGSNGTGSITVSNIDNGSSDACGIASMSLSKTSFDCSNVGANTVTLTVTDVNGNSATGNATVTVVDNTAPNAMCKNVTVTLSGGAASVTAAQVDNGSSDACGIASMSVSPSSFNCTNIGTNTVTLTVTDVNGNSSTCNATVTVVGTIPSVANITVTPSNNIYTGGVPTTIYLGYGPQSATLTTTATGGSSFSYAWFSGSALSCTNCQTTTFAPTTEGSYSKTVTATNNYGCTASKSVTMCVFNIVAPGGSPSNPKVYLCHMPPGNSNNPQTLNISVSAVPSHLGQHAGDRLGSCAASCANLATAGTTGDMYTEVTSFGEVDLVVYPNPSSGSFNFIVESSYDAPVTIQVVDVTGKVIITQNNLPHNVEFSIGESLPQGIYFAKVQQGEFTKVVRIVKVN